MFSFINNGLYAFFATGESRLSMYKHTPSGSIHPFWKFFPIPKGCKKAENIINNTLKDNENTEVELRSHKLNFGVLLIFDKKRFPGWQKNAFVLE